MRLARLCITGGVLLAGALMASGCGSDATGPAPSAEPRTWHVPADQPTIAAAARVAAPGDLILVAPGRYPEGDIVLATGVTLRGDGDRAEVRVEGADAGTLTVAAGSDTAAVESLTLSHLAGTDLLGPASFRRCRFLRGGRDRPAISVPGATVRFEECAFDSNGEVTSVGILGGALAAGGDVHLDRCTFTGNGGGCLRGGGASLAGTAVVNACRFQGCRADEAGGGLDLRGTGPFTLAGCVFESNSAGLHGGAICCPDGGLAASDCLFTENVSSSGGALLCGGEAGLTNCRFLTNVAASLGGAVRILGGAPRFSGCTFIENRSGSQGGACWSQSAPLVLTRCSLGGNESGDGGGIFLESGDLRLDYSIVMGNVAQGLGGGIHLVGLPAAGSVSLNDSAVSGNAAGIEAGGIFLLAGGNSLHGSYTTILDNDAPLHADGVIGDHCTAILTCCAVDTASWQVAGSLSLQDENCEFRSSSAAGPPLPASRSRPRS